MTAGCSGLGWWWGLAYLCAVVVRRTFLVDAGLTVAVLVGTAVAMVVAGGDARGPSGVVVAVITVLLVAPIMVWRRWPLGVLLVSSALMLVYYVLGCPGISPAFPLGVQLFVSALAGRTRWAVGVMAFFFTAGFVFLSLAQHVPLLRLVGNLSPHIALLAVVILLATTIRSRRELAAETRERLRQAEESRERDAARRVAEERLRIARELHDTVAHSMATIAVQAGSALHTLPEDDAARSALTAIRATSKDALTEMRGALGMLREPPEHRLDRLPKLLDAVRAAGLTVRLDTDGAAKLDDEVEHAAYRILQESLTNVLRHAGPAASARVRLAYEAETVTLSVSDDGVGPSNKQGNGLAGMRERAEAVGGTLTTGPGPQGGFAITARLPREARR